MTESQFDYAFDYLRSYFPTAGYGARKGQVAELRGEGRCSVRTLPKEAVDVVARLAVPLVREGRAEVVSSDTEVIVALVDGVLMRTVCRPGSKSACTVDDFVAAAASDGAWRDSPFRRRSPTSAPAGPVEESEGRAMSAYAARSWAPDDGADSMESARTAALARLSSYAFADGLAWMPCRPPELLPFVSTRDGVGIEVGWSFDDFDAFSDPHEGLLLRPAEGRPPTPLALVDTNASGKVRRNGDDFRALLSFGVDRVDDAVALAGALARDATAASLLGTKDDTPARGPTWEGQVAYLDPDGPWPRHRTGGIVGDVVSLVRDADPGDFRNLFQVDAREAAAFVGARAILEGSLPSDPEVLRTAVDDVTRLAVRDLRWHPFAACVASRWEAVERSRDLAPDDDGPEDLDEACLGF